MFSLTRRILWMLVSIVISYGLLVIVSMAVGSRNRSDIFAAPARASASREQWIYLLDPERLIKLRILPRVDTHRITSIQPQWAVGPGSLGRFYIHTVERDENGIKLLDVLYLHDVPARKTSRLIDRPADLYVGLPVDAPSSASPDGRYITFVDYSRGDLYVLDVQTGEAHQAIDVSNYVPTDTANTSTTRVSYSPAWGSDSRALAYVWDDTLFLWTPDEDQPRSFRFPEKNLGFSFWSADGKTLLMQSGESRNRNEMFAARIDAETNQVEMVVEDVARTSWMCDGRYLAYTTLRESDADDQVEVDDETPPSSTFMGHLVDTYADTTFNLDEVPQFAGIDHQYVWLSIHNCDQPEWVIIWQQLDTPTPGQNQLYVLPSSRLYAFHLLNTQTGDVIKVADTAHALYWRPDLNQYVYYARGDQDTQEIYTFAPSADARPVKIGQFTPTHLSIPPMPSNDFSYMVGIESGPSSGIDGRLVRIDMQTGEEVYLTPEKVSVGSYVRWD